MRVAGPRHGGRLGLAAGESEVRGDAPADTRFYVRVGIPSLVPWLVVSGQAGSWLSLRICLSKTGAGA
jgi:hypothetical protein